MRRLLGLLTRRPAAVEQDADDELRTLLEERVDHLVARGMAPDAARAEALRRLGSDAAVARVHVRASAVRRERAASRREWAGGLVADVRYAARGLAREPLFAGFAILVLALGIGANAAMFGLVDRLLLRGPAHVRDPERVVRLYWTLRQPGGEWTTSAAFDDRVYANLATELQGASGLAMQTGAWPSTLLGEGASARLVPSSRATANLLHLLGAQPVLGRFFTQDEQEARTAPPVLVLGHGLWRTEYGADSSIVGRTVPVGGRPFTVVGVAPPGFTGAALDRVDVWLPLTARTDAAARHWGTGFSTGPMIVARLAPGVTLEAIGREATATYRRTYDGTDRRLAEGRLSAAPLRFGRDGTEAPEPRLARWLAGLAVVVLLMACANLANLLLARTVRRSRELAVRRALGAGRGRVLRLLLVSSAMLVALGGALGLAMAGGISLLVRRVLLPNVDWAGGAVDGRVLVVALATMAACALLVGLFPAQRAAQVDVAAALKAGPRDGGGRRAATRHALVAAQAALAMLLLVGAGLFVRSLQRVQQLALGVDPERVVVLSPRWPRLPAAADSASRSREERRREVVMHQAVDRLAMLPEVEHAAAAAGVPFGTVYSVPLRLPGRDSLPRLPGGFNDPDVSAVTPDYFRTVGTRLLRGRLFDASGRESGTRVAVVSATMARVLWPGGDAVGQCLLVADGKTCTRVIGVVEDARRNRVREEPIMRYYIPVGQEPVMGSADDLLVRPRGEVATAIPALRAALRQLDPTLLFVDAQPLVMRLEPQIRTWRVGALVFTLFAGLALLVAAVGTFSVVAYVVEQRRHEVGVRLALGARGRQVVRLVLSSTLGATALGITVGGVGALWGGRFAEPLLFETTARDPVVLGVVTGLLLLVAAGACAWPALRARRVDPMEVLRTE